MNKPDWKDAPEWAEWLAQDADGAWWWFQNEPEQRGGGEDGRWHPLTTGKFYRATKSSQPGPKEPRPKPSITSIHIDHEKNSTWTVMVGDNVLCRFDSKNMGNNPNAPQLLALANNTLRDVCNMAELSAFGQ